MNLPVTPHSILHLAAQATDRLRRLPENAQGQVKLDGDRVDTLVPAADPGREMATRARALQRPVIMVHGLDLHSDCFFSLKSFLCSNARNEYGGTYSKDHEAAFKKSLSRHPNAKVFAIDFSDNRKPPTEVAQELTRAIQLVCEKTGAPSVDLVTHSMGGLQAREHLADGGKQVHRIVMLAPPNKGAGFADIGLALWDTGLFRIFPVAHHKVLEFLKTEKGSYGQADNGLLEHLDAAWDAGKRVPTWVITGTGVPTPTDGKWLAAPGDGLVTAESAHLDHTEMRVAQPRSLPGDSTEFSAAEPIRYNHLSMLSDPVIAQAVDHALHVRPNAG